MVDYRLTNVEEPQAPQPAPLNNNPLPQPKGNKKTIVLVSILILLILILGISILFWMQYSPKKGAENQVAGEEAIDTSDWQTYTNEEYGFEFKYLNIGETNITDWIKDDFSNTDVFPLKDGLLTFGQYIEANGPGSPICVTYSVNVANANNKNINDWVEEVKAYNDRSFDYQGLGEEGHKVNGKITSIQDINVDDILGKVVLIEGGYPLNTGEFGIVKDNKIYSITYFDNNLDNHINCKNSSKNYQKIFYNIISTFKFVEPKEESSEIDNTSKIDDANYTFTFTEDSVKIFNNTNFLQEIKIGINAMDAAKYDLERWSHPIAIIDRDINFDGYKDLSIEVGNGYGGVNFFFNFYLFDPQTKKFTEVEELKNVCNPNIQDDKKQIIAGCKSGPTYCEKIYQFENGNYTVTSSPENLEGFCE